MAIKKPSQRFEKPNISATAVEELANELAEKPYGKENSSFVSIVEEGTARTTISLPKPMLRLVEDLALKNKRAGKDPKNISSIIRKALEIYLKDT